MRLLVALDANELGAPGAGPPAGPADLEAPGATPTSVGRSAPRCPCHVRQRVPGHAEQLAPIAKQRP
eukprot:4351600-Pyramimonas_sp.AAC.1